LTAAAAACAALLGWTAPAGAAGFGLFEAGTKAMGLAGAFTAQANDGSAMFHNVGGLAFATEREILVGATYITFSEATFDGADPFPGSDVSEEQSSLNETLPHAYYVQPLAGNWRFGLGVYAPFGLTTQWKDAANFSGRYLSTRAALRVLDVNPSLAWQATPNLGIGVGVIARFSDVQLDRWIPFVNPFTQRVVDVGYVGLESDFGTAYGFNVGILHKYNNSFSWGLSYRSKATVDYEGDARFTQISTGIPALDAGVAAQIPFGRSVPVKTSIDYPDMASLGVAIALSPSMTFEVDANWTGWSSFQEVPITFVGFPALSSTLPEKWDDVYNYRAGLSWKSRPNCEWRFGFVYDESPQPEQYVSPLLPDNNRTGFTIGYGHQFSKRSLDLALMYLPFDERKVDENASRYYGTYNTTAWLLGVSFGF
jgi:long-chain fatty acid transport protein